MNPLHFKHPLWLAGFRPFFLMASLWGSFLAGSWGLIFAGYIRLPRNMNMMQWHAHEMLFGFGGAVLIGFLLTASKNWVGVRGIHGKVLMFLSILWISERLFLFDIFKFPAPLKHFFLSLFFLFGGGYIAWTLIKFRKNDSFKDNYFFLFLLAVILIAKNLVVSNDYYQHGISMSIGLFRLAFVVMFERTMRQFMKSTENQLLFQNPLLDASIKMLVAFATFQSFFSSNIASLILSSASILLLARWLLWKPHLGFKKFGNATMYIGYFGLTLHFALEGMKDFQSWMVGAYPTHVFTFLCMGIIIPSMLIRISKGHTGRKPGFETIDKLPIIAILIGAFFRLVLPLSHPEYYQKWILIAGLCWSASFLILFVRISPFLLKPRIDGKIH